MGQVTNRNSMVLPQIGHPNGAMAADDDTDNAPEDKPGCVVS